MRFDRTGKSKCSACPLASERRVWSTCDRADPDIAIIGEAPGEREEVEGKPFIGPAGGLLTSALAQATLQRRNIWITNVLSCRPPGNVITSYEAEQAIACCKPGFDAEVAYLMDHVKVFIPTGNVAMAALGLETGITKRRGSVYILGKKGKCHVIAIPTFHPSYIQRGAWKQVPTWVQDFCKARDLAFLQGGYKPPKEYFVLNPVLGDLEVLRDKAKGKLVGVDIETTGLRPGRADLVVVGVAVDGEHATSFPFICQNGVRYWRNEDERTARQLLVDTLRVSRPVFQNAAFDVPHLEAAGIRVPRIEHDTLALHHDIHPELPHNLGYIVSIYGRTPYWKEEVLKKTSSILSLPDDVLRTYNLRDAVVLLQILPPLLEDLKINEVEDTYRESMNLLPITMAMTANGMPISLGRLRWWKSDLKRRLTLVDQDMRDEFSLPGSFNLQSTHHLDLLFGKAPPAQFVKAQEDLEKYYEPGSKLKRTTKRYAEIKAKVIIASEVQPLVLPKGYRQHRTETGRDSYNEEALLELKIAAINRSEAIKTFVRPTPEHLAEGRGLGHLISFIELHGKRAELQKLLTTYTDFPIWEDGRVHPKYKVFGTVTGRLSSGGESEYTSRDDKVNAQNIPEEARRIFVAPEGFEILTADYSHLELRCLAYVSNDQPLIDVFEKGINVHDQNTQDLFGIDKSSPMWNAARRAAKVYIFGRNYGGGLLGIHRRVMLQVPDLPLTFERFREVDEVYRRKHPAYTLWRDRTIREVVNSKQLRNAFGRLRIFLGTDDEIQREGLNFPIQSLAADIINRAMISFWPKIQSMKSLLIGQVHDSVVFQAAKAERKKLIGILRTGMEQTFEINNHEVQFPVKFKAGPSWGEQSSA